MTNFNCTLIDTPQGKANIIGACTIRFDEQQDSYTLKIKSGFMRGLFKGSCINQSQMVSLNPVTDKIRNQALTEGALTLVKVSGKDFLEGSLSFIGKDQMPHSLFVRGTSKSA